VTEHPVTEHPVTEHPVTEHPVTEHAVIAPDESAHIVRRFAHGVRHPKQWMTNLCGGEAAFPLLVLFGLNAVDELDRTAFGILLPEIRESFNINISTALSIVALSSVAALALQVPIAQYADKSKRIPLVVIGAVAWAIFSGMTGLATGLILLTVARSGSSLGKAVIDPTHNSLIADYYPIESRARVYSFHRAANALGAFVGPLSAGMLAFYFGWRVPFLVFVVPTLILAVVALRMKEPIRGRWERQATGASQEIIDTEEESPSFAESWRTAHKVQSLRRIWWSLPFLATSLIGFVTLAALLYEQKFNLDERARGVAAAISEPFALVGLVIGARIATRRYAGNVKGLIRFVASVALLTSVATAGFALAPNVYIAVAFNCVISASLAIIGPGVLAALSLAIPPRARATGFAIGSLWVIPGLFVLPVIGWIADNWSIEIGMLVMIPMFMIGSLLLRGVADVIDDDIAQVWQSAAARSEVLYDRRQGTTNLLLLKGVEAGYDNRTVLHGIDLRLDEGEVVALLGTNGAGKSTLLKSISGIVEADRGAIVLDGRDITHAPPNEIAALGIVQMPGGQGVFGSLTVKENLELAGWTNRRDPAGVEAATAEVLDMFPVLADRLESPAANMSGGQQQMLALAMSFVMRPKVLLIDELSLGLAPVVVGQLLPIVRRMADDGVTVVLVEQSVNVALTVAERAYFMERGTIKFDGPTAELLARPDLLRSVFLSAAQPNPTAAGDHEGFDREVIDRTSAPVLSVNELSVTFGGLRAVTGATFDVWPREIVGVIGPNGAGKTTIFDLISGFTPLDSGRISLNGRDISALSAAARAAIGLGRSFQDARLFPELTVNETLAIAQERFVGSRGVMVAALHLPMVVESEQQVAMRIDELIELMGLGDYRHNFVRELSTGTRRVVDLACLVAHRPSVILLDEPTSGIAQREVEALAPVIRRLRDEMGASLVIVEHDIPFVSDVSDRLLALEQGQVIATGLPADVLAHPDVIESYLGTSGAAITRSGGTE
jgi:ABC-type branched-subunit amino acid transport system ATPase component/predicted MFS family arabinose efflux permease